MKNIHVLAATGMLGTGFSEASFDRALKNNPSVIGCDAGSTDPGPHYLGHGTPMVSREATKRDLTIMIKGALKNNIPLLIGSAGTAGSNVHVDWTVDIVKEIAKEENLSFSLAAIYSEISQPKLINAFRKGKIKPLNNAHDLSEESILHLSKVVGQMGPEPYINALNQGAQVVVAGRSSDTSIFAAVPIKEGINHGIALHASKILECGAGCAETRIHPDCMSAWMYDDHFIVEPPNPKMKCTPVSVLSHLLYENYDPYHLYEPGGMLNTSDAHYESFNERGVKVTNSEFEPVSMYTVRLEGVEHIGYRRIAIAGIRDPFILRQLPNFLEECKNVISKKVKESLNIEKENFKILFRIYGDSGVMGELEPFQGKMNHEVGLLTEVIADSAVNSQSIMSIAWHTMLHHPIKEWSGLVSQLAFPFSPPDSDMGPVYRFGLNHIMEVEDPLELFEMNISRL
ncbi:Protein of unknown function [Lentibacillus halodurans]|uniref:Acyclic terpene utilisation N-terminal domain-containing protein n=1 Tax=Lentibacillus halodurans TaxID=237679 RepID=A0A1I0XKQ6_9BACI|nr:acyclic terpene utilization AtuA family protein [Lentibacillus halodurans]SFB01464.1 Protein of unknown function [Lentibacillus halodurans]